MALKLTDLRPRSTTIGVPDAETSASRLPENGLDRDAR